MRFAPLFLLRLASVCGFVVLVVGPVSGQTWVGGLWSNPASWQGGVLPANNGTADVTLESSSTPNNLTGACPLDASWNIRSLTFNEYFYTFPAGGPGRLTQANPDVSVTLQNGLFAGSDYPMIVDPAIVLGAAQTWSIGDPIPNRGHSHTLTVNGRITGSGALTLQVANTAFRNVGRFVFTGENTFAGNLTIGNATVLASGAGPRLGAGDVTLQAYAVLKLDSASNLAASHAIAMSPLSVLVLNDASINPANLVSVSGTTGGIIALGVTNYSNPLNLAAIGNGQMFLGSSAAATYSAATLAPSVDGVYRLGAGAVAPSAALTIAGHDNVLTGANSVVIGGTDPNGSPTPNADVFVNAAVYLNNANNYTGGTTLVSGLLDIGAEGAVGSGSVTVASAGQTSLYVDTPSRTFSAPLFFTGSSAFTALVLRSPGGDLLVNGALDLGGGRRTLYGNLSSGVTTLAGGISNGTLSLSGGAFVLQNINSGGIEVSVGARVQVASDASLGAPKTPLTLSGGLLTSTAADLTLDRNINIPSSGSGISTAGTITVNGAITGNQNAGLAKVGAGTLVITNGNSLPLTVNGGTLRLSNATGGPVITVQSGALSGTGFAGFTSVGSGAHVAPGAAAPGTLTIGSGLSLNSGANLDFRLGRNGSDQLVISGHVFQAFGNVAVNLADAGGLAPGQTYTLVDFGDTDLSGTTASLFILGSGPVGGTLELVGQTLRLTTATLTPLQQWQRQYFGTSADPNAALTANPAKDGVSNLIKYALGLDPLHSAVAGLPTVTASAGILTLTYQRSVAATDVTYQPLASDDLQTWDAAGITQSVDAPNGATQTVRATAPRGRRFMKLSVTGPR